MIGEFFVFADCHIHCQLNALLLYIDSFVSPYRKKQTHFCRNGPKRMRLIIAHNGRTLVCMVTV